MRLYVANICNYMYMHANGMMYAYNCMFVHVHEYTKLISVLEAPFLFLNLLYDYVFMSQNYVITLTAIT